MPDELNVGVITNEVFEKFQESMAGEDTQTVEPEPVETQTEAPADAGVQGSEGEEVTASQEVTSPPPTEGEPEPAEPSPPATKEAEAGEEDWDGAIRELLTNEEWVQAHPGTAKQLHGMQAHFTKTTQDVAEIKRAAEEAQREAKEAKEAWERAAKELEAFGTPDEPGDKFFQYVDRQDSIRQREEETKYDPTEYQRRIDEEGQESAELYRLSIENKKLLYEKEDMGSRLSSLEAEVGTWKQQQAAYSEYQKAMNEAKQFGLNDQQADLACTIHAGYKAQRRDIEFKQICESLRPTEQPPAKPAPGDSKAKQPTAADIIEKGVAQAKRTSAPTTSAPAQHNPQAPPFDPTSQGEKKMVDYIEAELKKQGMI